MINRATCAANLVRAPSQEFDHINEEAAIYKKIGVVLVKQDQEDAKGNIKRRLEMIQGQLKDVSDKMAANEKAQDEIKMRIVVSTREIWETEGRWCVEGV